MDNKVNPFKDGWNVCVGSYGYAAEGDLRDKWVKLPMPPDNVDTWLSGNGLVDDEHEETYVSAFDNVPFDVDSGTFESVSLDKLNLLAMQLADLPDEDYARISACIGKLDDCRTVANLMNLIEQVDEAPVYLYDGALSSDLPSWSPQVNYALTVIDGDDEFQSLYETSRYLQRGFSPELYGRNCEEAGDVTLCWDGYIDNLLLDDLPHLFDRYGDVELADRISSRYAAKHPSKAENPTQAAAAARKAAAGSVDDGVKHNGIKL